MLLWLEAVGAKADKNIMDHVHASFIMSLPIKIDTNQMLGREA